VFEVFSMSVSIRVGVCVSLLLACVVGCSGDPDYSGRRPWSETSARVELSSFGYWEGSSRFDAEREQLTAEQLRALEGLREIPTPDGPLGADFVSYRVEISDADGSVAHYRAAEDNITDSDEGDLSLRTLDVDTLRPFLGTFHCLTASQTRDGLGNAPLPGADVPTGGANTAPSVEAAARPVPENWADAPDVSTAAQGCVHGIFMPYTCHDVWLELQVEAPGTYQLRSEGCFESLELAVFSSDGEQQLATASGNREACPALEQTFTEAGSYPLLLRKTNGAGCSEMGTAGDFFFRIASEANP
jgi:hypothetical protein